MQRKREVLMKITDHNCIFLFEVTVILAKKIPLLFIPYGIRLMP
jgi:hypothetical protein